jgi:hypothetical protein
VAENIKGRLIKLRQNGNPLTVIAIRGVMIATIIREQPEIMQRKFNDRSTFRASDNFIRGWLRSSLCWTRRKGTRAAQKLPDNWEDQCEKSAMRKAYLIKEYDIPPELYANSDQTQRLYAPGDKLTYAETGSKQVSVVGGDEKRAFTVMVTVTSSGTLLPFQAIYHGKTERSCPDPKSPNYGDAIAAGFRFEHSGTKTYWANQLTMRSFVDHILAPYFDDAKVKLGCPLQQRSLWTIDVWSVHRSKEFRGWMQENHPFILVDFVPGGCTGVAQPCDVGIQRPFKHITNQCFVEDVVNATLSKIDNGEDATIDDRLPTLRNASVRWLWTAYQALNKKEIVEKVSWNHIFKTDHSPGGSQAFQLCVVRQWNMSHHCLRSFDMQEKLRELRTSNDPFWDELTRVNACHQYPITAAVVAEDIVPDLDDEEEELDDTSVSLHDVIAATHCERAPRKSRPRSENGRLRAMADAENLDEIPVAINSEDKNRAPMPDEEVGGRGKRKKMRNKLYSLVDFTRHWDNDDSDIE